MFGCCGTGKTEGASKMQEKIDHEEIKAKILIVDDCRLNLQVLHDILSSDHEVLTAVSGKEALAVVASSDIDLILLNVIMPEMDGYEVCKQLKGNPETKNIPVIFVTAMDHIEDEEKGLEIGAIDYIHKPFNDSIIRMRVNNHLKLKKYRDILEKASSVDDLTGLANRRYLDEVFNIEWRRALRDNSSLSLIMIDIDSFKEYNDYYGHLAGDDCLRNVAVAIKSSLQRSGDFVSRYGGEEFLVILPSTPRKGAITVAENIRKKVESLEIEHMPSKICGHITVSCGVATAIPDENISPNTLLKLADSALYKAKGDGRNVVRSA